METANKPSGKRLACRAPRAAIPGEDEGALLAQVDQALVGGLGVVQAVHVVDVVLQGAVVVAGRDWQRLGADGQLAVAIVDGKGGREVGGWGHGGVAALQKHADVSALQKSPVCRLGMGHAPIWRRTHVVQFQVSMLLAALTRRQGLISPAGKQARHRAAEHAWLPWHGLAARHTVPWGLAKQGQVQKLIRQDASTAACHCRMRSQAGRQHSAHASFNSLLGKVCKVQARAYVAAVGGHVRAALAVQLANELILLPNATCTHTLL